MIERIEQFILHMLKRRNGKMDLYELKTRVLIAFKPEMIDSNIVDRVLHTMKINNYISIEEIESDEFKRCVDSTKDKRIKNVYQYCRKRYHTEMYAVITELGKIKYLHNIYCFSLHQGDSNLSAMENMRRAMKEMDFYTTPPDKC